MFRVLLALARSATAVLLIATSSVFVAMAEGLAFDLKVERGHVAEAMRLIRVKQGDIVKLRWTTDRPLILHLHGYDIEMRIAPGAPTELTFTAYATGRFPIHLHARGERGGHSHDEEPLVNVEVYPR